MTVYKEVETAQDSGGLLSLFSSLEVSKLQPPRLLRRPCGNFDPSTMPQRDFDSSSFGGGMP